MFTTDRLILRPFRTEDLDDMLRLWNDPLVQRGLTNTFVIPRAPNWKDKVAEFVDNALVYVVITSKDTGAFMGMCSIGIEGSSAFAKNRNGRTDISIFPEYWNKGYGTEALKFVVDYAFRWLALHRVSLGVCESNKGAIASYQKLGFTIEGRKRKASWADGDWEDILDMAILEDEWAALYWKQAS